MTRNYLDIIAEVISTNPEQSALDDFYLTGDSTAQDTSRGNRYTYGGMSDEIAHLADCLARLGLRKGDHIALCGANSAHWIIAFLAVTRMQGVPVTVMHALAPEQIARMVDFADAKALLADSDICSDLEGLPLSKLQYMLRLDDWSVARGVVPETAVPVSDLTDRFSHVSQSEPDSLAMICFTSGSSGFPKGVMLSNRSLSNNVQQAFYLYPHESNAAFLSILPYSHMAGMIGDVLSQLAFGKHIYILREDQSLDAINKAVLCVSPYMFVSVPAIFSVGSLSKKADVLSSLLHSCKLIFMGGAKLDEQIERRIVNSPVPLSLIYGQTETGASISISPYNRHRLSSSGKIVPGMTACIAPDGEILVKGENVMLGYYKDPEATAQKIDGDGWLHTGDKGYLDEDGYLFVEGRLGNDMIVLANGENIHPENIEAMINAIPEVSESIVLAREGRLIAIVVPKIPIERTAILRAINPQLPLFSQLCDVQITDKPLERTQKKTLKRYLYK